jgi:HK97 family phage portal protein
VRLWKRVKTPNAASAPNLLNGRKYPFFGPADALDLGGGQTAAGAVVTPDTALGNIAVYACVRVIAESIGSLPVHVYKREGRSRVRVEDDREFLLSQEPNPYMSAMTFWETVLGHANLWGNAYVLRTYDGEGRADGLWPLDPRRTAPYRTESGALFYGSMIAGETVAFDPADILHVRAFGTGDLGISPIGIARQAIGTQLAAEEYAGRFWSNDARPGGIIEYTNKLTDEQHKAAMKRWKAAHEGVRRSHLVAVLDNGAAWRDVGMPPGDAQFIETRKFAVREIARLYRVPPHMIGDLEGTVTYASIEQQALDFVVHSLRPWIVRLEQALGRVVFRSLADRRQGVYARFEVEGLLRGDTKTRNESYAIARQNGWLSVNEIRALEDMSAIGPEGDTYLQPLNFGPLGVDPQKANETARTLLALGVPIPTES